MTTHEESHERLISTGASGLVRRMDHRLELVSRLMEEIQRGSADRIDAEVAEANEILRVKRPGEERDFEIAAGVKMTFCWCPPGDFVMGSPTIEEGRFDNEEQVEVTLTKGYWMGKHQVTQAQWEAVMGSNPSHFQGANLPIETVSWHDAHEFLGKLNARLGSRDGGTMALPTEAQWEYAARAGTAGVYSGGPLDQVAWYDGNSGDTTHPVGTKKANAWGLHDMSGNVWEWCQACSASGLVGGADPKGLDSGSFRVVRGGGWFGDASDCRVAERRYKEPASAVYCIGLRLVRSSVPENS